jgi:hypothetical protein
MSYDLAPRPPPPPSRSPVSELCRRHTERQGKIDKLLTGEGGRGWARSHTYCLKKTWYKLFNTLTYCIEQKYSR